MTINAEKIKEQIEELAHIAAQPEHIRPLHERRAALEQIRLLRWERKHGRELCAD